MRLDAKVVANPTEEETRGISGATLPVVVRPSLEGHVTDLSLGLLMSTVTGLIDLIEDEIIPQPLPMKVVTFYLNDWKHFMFCIEIILQIKISPGGFWYSTCLLPQVLVERIGLHLTEDRVPANITSPGSVPTQVWIPRLLLKRDTEGVFTILPQPEGTGIPFCILF